MPSKKKHATGKKTVRTSVRQKSKKPMRARKSGKAKDLPTTLKEIDDRMGALITGERWFG